MVMSRDARRKFFSLADIEWMILPPLLTGQFYVVEALNKNSGLRVPIAAVTWAFVSEELDERLQQGESEAIRLRPGEWKSGEIGWLIDAVGNSAALAKAIEWLRANPFKERPLKIKTIDGAGRITIKTLDELTPTDSSENKN